MNIYVTLLVMLDLYHSMGGMEEFDEALIAMANRSGGLENLMKGFFSFMHRKTDLYVVFDQSSKAAKMVHFLPILCVYGCDFTVNGL